MAQAVAVVGLVMTAYSTYQQYQAAEAQRDAADDARELAQRNARFAEQEGAETLRRMKAQQRQKLGRARAIAAASGGKITGSIENYIGSLKSEQDRESAWLARSTKEQAQIIRMGGQYTSKMAEAAAQQTMAGAWQTAGQGTQQWWNTGGQDTYEWLKSEYKASKTK